MKEIIDEVLKKREIRLTEKLEVLVTIYNEVLEKVVRIEIDYGLTNYLTITEPMNKEHNQKKTQLDVVKKQQDKVLSIIKQLISEEVKGKDGKKD